MSTYVPFAPLARQTRLVFNKSCIQTYEMFLIIHVDIWGPLRLQIRTKCTMLVTIVDDFSRYTWGSLIQHKPDYLTCFKKFYSYVQTQFEKHIKIIITDNAKELSQMRYSEIFTTKRVFSFKQVGQTHPNKMGWLKERIGIL